MLRFLIQGVSIIFQLVSATIGLFATALFSFGSLIGLVIAIGAGLLALLPILFLILLLV
jgi:hypothetical protein